VRCTNFKHSFISQPFYSHAPPANLVL
jgi:hypothetical protein